MKFLFVVLTCILSVNYLRAQESDIFAHWRFEIQDVDSHEFDLDEDEYGGWSTRDEVSGEEFEVTGFYFGIDSRGYPGFHVSDATSVWQECKAKVNPETKTGMSLNQWYQVVGTYDPQDGGSGITHY